jgi:opacity protein-like surface antigen
MKRSGFRLLGVAVMVSMAAAFAVSQDAAQTAPKPGKAELTGTWTGYTFLGDYSRADFDLNLKKEGDVYAGQISDQAGIIPTMDIKNPAYKDGLLTFEIDFPNDTGTSRIAIELKLEGETLKGRWLDPDGNSNVIELTRKK